MNTLRILKIVWRLKVTDFNKTLPTGEKKPYLPIGRLYPVGFAGVPLGSGDRNH